MANYNNSLGESELFGRMTAGFSKVMESVQTGRFQRDGYGTIVESCNEDENAAPTDGDAGAAPSDGAGQGGADAQGSADDAEAVANATPEQVNGSVTEADATVAVSPMDVAAVWNDKRHFQIVGINVDPKSGSIAIAYQQPVKGSDKTIPAQVVLTHKDVCDILGFENFTLATESVDESQRKPMKKLVPEGCCGGKGKKVDEGALGSSIGGAAGAVGGTMAGSAIGHPVVGLVGGAAAGSAIGSKLTEGCCGGKKGKKVLKEGALGSAIGGVAGAAIGSAVGHPLVGAGIGAACGHNLTEGDAKLCKTCGKPLDETGMCPDCQEIKENDDEIKLQVPANIRRQAALKANAKANQEKLAKAIRGGKADGIVKEDDEGDAKPVFGTFTIKIETGNAAFGENADETAAEIRDIIEKKLDEVASVVKEGGCVKLLDTNGNSVGTMCFEASEE